MLSNCYQYPLITQRARLLAQRRLKLNNFFEKNFTPAVRSPDVGPAHFGPCRSLLFVVASLFNSAFRVLLGISMRLDVASPVLIALLVPAFAAFPSDYVPSHVAPPNPVTEFRGVWVATVANIDWPSRPGLSTAAQKAELTAILDRAAHLKLNAIILQVRPTADALYASPIEPWSEYLTGTMGRPPRPSYDPLAFAVEQAHRRGLELHAWFNPFRASHDSSKSAIAPNHVSRTHPEFVRTYGKCLWLDPGEPAAREYVLRVILDVVKRYDIDGIHFDDYFYPYAEQDAGGRDLAFPDAASWRKWGPGTGMTRDDWRRENLNQFVRQAYQKIKAAKPWVKFGISPFGIWRPHNPPQIKGMDAYAELYADSRKWLANGWLDYCAPQLYWPIEPKDQSFPARLDWWAAQNPKGRHLWPGIATVYAPKWPAGEIANQIQLARQQGGVTGYILWSMRSLMQNDALARVLQHDINNQLALVPSLSGALASSPDRSSVSLSELPGGRLRILCRSTDGSAPSWLIQTQSDGKWSSEILHGKRVAAFLGANRPDWIAVTQIDRGGRAGKTVAYQRK